jgi:uncharacterized LabA/DUF88 family protein
METKRSTTLMFDGVRLNAERRKKGRNFNLPGLTQWMSSQYRLDDVVAFMPRFGERETEGYAKLIEGYRDRGFRVVGCSDLQDRIDVQLAIELLNLVAFGMPSETIVLVTCGPSALAPVVEKVRSLGVRIEVHGVDLPRELKLAANRCVDLSDWMASCPPLAGRSAGSERHVVSVA